MGDSLKIIYLTVDNKRYTHVAHTEEINDGKNLLFTDKETDEPIFEILWKHSNSNIIITKLFDYFVKGAIISDIELDSLDKDGFEYHIQESIPDDFFKPMSINRLAELLLKINF